jgi:hypothetical protein
MLLKLLWHYNPTHLVRFYVAGICVHQSAQRSAVTPSQTQLIQALLHLVEGVAWEHQQDAVSASRQHNAVRETLAILSRQRDAVLTIQYVTESSQKH